MVLQLFDGTEVESLTIDMVQSDLFLEIAGNQLVSACNYIFEQRPNCSSSELEITSRVTTFKQHENGVGPSCMHPIYSNVKGLYRMFDIQ